MVTTPSRSIIPTSIEERRIANKKQNLCVSFYLLHYIEDSSIAGVGIEQHLLLSQCCSTLGQNLPGWCAVTFNKMYIPFSHKVCQFFDGELPMFHVVVQDGKASVLITLKNK